jgi:phosphoesterase RecJ-like protein
MNSPIQADAIFSIGKLLKEAKSVMIVAHLRPDGDAIGSVVGMGLALQAGGKKIQMILKDPFPARYRFLKGTEFIQHAPMEAYDLFIALDCGDLPRLGDFFKERSPDINIDHHITNDNFARVNLVIPQEVATSAILAEYLPKWGFPLDTDSASALCMGLLTDTNGFRIPTVTPNTLELAANLMRQGAPLPEIYQQSLSSQSLQTSKLWGLALTKIQLEKGLLWTSITIQDREWAGYKGRDDAEITNFLTSISGCKVAILFNEQSENKTKVSWRSRNAIDVAKLAQHYNGGGHPNAAGAEIAQSLRDAEQEILRTTQQIITGEIIF